MRRFWEAAKQYLFPGWKAALPLAVLAAAALLLVFARGLDGTPAAYAVYLLSAYALTAVTTAAVRGGRAAWRRICAVPLVVRWREDAYWRVRMGLALSFLINLCYAGLRVAGAVVYASVWDGALGCYYVLLCAVRLYLLRRMPAASEPGGREKELRMLRRTGWLLMGLDAALAAIAVQIVRDGRGYDYPGTMIYAAAAYSFYCLALATVNAVRYRRFRSPVLSAAKAVSMTTALVSIFSLETAMLTQFGGSAPFRFRMTAATAAVVCAAVMAMAVGMVRAAGRGLKAEKEETT